MSARFHAPLARQPGEVIDLSDDESLHLERVLRLKAGDPVRVFNGVGGEFDAVVEQSSKSGVRVRLGGARTPAPEPRVSITLALAVLKGDKMDGAVRDAVMMGAAAIQPLVAERSEVSAAALERGHRRERWQKIAVSSAKQCGRATVPLILEPMTFDALMSALRDARLPTPAFLLVEPAVGSGAVALGDLGGDPPPTATVVIGPEGGWTARELELAAGLCQLVLMGGRTLRADAVPVVALAALLTVWGDL